MAEAPGRFEWEPIGTSTAEAYWLLREPEVAGETVPVFLRRRARGAGAIVEAVPQTNAANANGGVPASIKRRLSVGIVTHDFWPATGGQGRCTYELWRRLSENEDFQLHVFSPAPNDLPGHHRVFPWTWRSGGHIVFSVMASLAIERWRRRYGIDVFHLNGGPGGVSLLRRPHAPVIYAAHHTYGQQEQHMAFHRWKRLLKSMERRSYLAADAIVAVTKSTAEALVEDYDVPATGMTVIPNGVDGDLFRSAGQTREPLTLLFVGRLDERKGVEFLLRAMPEIARQVAGVKLTIVGSGPLADWVRSFIQEHGLKEAVHFTHGISDQDLVELYSRSMVAVVPSAFEGFGLVAVEAMACGTPVVATRSPGLRDVVEDGRSGVLVQHGDTAALVMAVRRLLTDRSLWMDLSYGARASIGAYDWRSIAAKWCAVYERVATGGLETGVAIPCVR